MLFAKYRIITISIFLANLIILLGIPNLNKLEASEEELLSKNERKWLDSHSNIKLAPDPEFLPIEYFNSDDKYIGIAADFVTLIEKKLNFKLNIIRLKNWEEVLEKTRDQEVDMWGAGTATPQRLEYMLFTEPFIELPAVIIVRNQAKNSLSLKELEKMKVAVISGYGIHDYLSNNNPLIKLDTVPDISTGLKKVSFGMVDALVANVALASYYIEKDGISNLKISGDSGYFYKWGFASRKDWPVLNQILQKGIELVSEKEKQAIYRKWVGLKADSSFKLKNILIPLVVVVAIFLVVGTLIYNRLLKKEVQKRTEELEKELVERKRAETESIIAKEDAEKASKAKSEFLARMSHELRTPMNSILGFGQILEVDQEKILTKTYKKNVNHILKAGNHLLGLINEVLDLSQIESGELKVSLQNINVFTLVEELVQLIGPIAEQNDVTINWESIEKNVFILADNNRLKQILINLVSNGIKYNRNNGTVFISCDEKKQGFLRIKVEDNGIGIPKDKLESIFLQFVQVDMGIKKIEGTGIGLAVTKKLVELMNGTINVESELGKGSCFTIELPKGV